MTTITPPVVTVSAPTATTPNMRDFVWGLNSTSGFFDVFNEFTPDNNQGNLDVISSKIYITLSTSQGEWANDPTFGLPQTILFSNSDNPDVLSQIVVNSILTVQNVNSVIISEIAYNPVIRVLNSTFSANTVYGIVPVAVGS